MPLCGVGSTVIFRDDFLVRHCTAPGHPECPERLAAVQRGIGNRPVRAVSRTATREEVALCHDPRYVEDVLAVIAEGETELAGGDVSVSPDSGEAALRAAGCALEAVDAVLAGTAEKAFCAIRPPGHHARPSAPMGFCLFNNVALAARHAQKRHGLTRVAIVDWDVHHGNGTQEIFYADGTVLFFSTHQSPWYPSTGAASETGAGKGEGCIVNRPLPAGSGRAEVFAAVDDFLPVMEKFRPELLLISAGFDSRAGDPLGRFRLTDEDFADLTTRLADDAARLTGGRVVSLLEGGYHLDGLARGVDAHLKALGA